MLSYPLIFYSVCYGVSTLTTLFYWSVVDMYDLYANHEPGSYVGINNYVDVLLEYPFKYKRLTVYFKKLTLLLTF